MVKINTREATATPLTDAIVGKSTDAPPPVKRGRGRPRKYTSTGEAIVGNGILGGASYVAFDIETGPAQLDILQELFRFPELGDFDPTAVKLGNATKPETVAAKLAEARENHLPNWIRERRTALDKFIDGAALDPITGRVVAVGMQLTGQPCEILGIDSLPNGNGEESILKSWWGLVGECLKQKTPMLGWNIFQFDLPFLVNRSRLLGTAIPAGVRHGRYWNPLFVDLMSCWTFDGYKTYAGLDDVSRAFGLPGKVEGVDGKDFHRLWADDRPRAIEYLTRDVELVKQLAERMGVV